MVMGPTDGGSLSGIVGPETNDARPLTALNPMDPITAPDPFDLSIEIRSFGTWPPPLLPYRFPSLSKWRSGVAPPSSRTDPVGLVVSAGVVVSPPVFDRATLFQDAGGSYGIERIGMVGVGVTWFVRARKLQDP